MPTMYDDRLATKTLYAAENRVLAMLDRGGAVDFHGSMLSLDGCKVRRFEPFMAPAVQGMINGLWPAHGGTGRAPLFRISERAGGGRAWYSRSAHEIVLPLHRWAWNDLVLLHELAHALTSATHNQRSAHGHEWRKAYAALVSDVVGPEAGLLLMDALDL
jgi:putative metallohydrolase (TIGR04338 family)